MGAPARGPILLLCLALCWCPGAAFVAPHATRPRPTKFAMVSAPALLPAATPLASGRCAQPVALAPVSLALDGLGMLLKLTWRILAIVAAARVVMLPRIARPLSGALARGLKAASQVAELWHSQATMADVAARQQRAEKMASRLRYSQGAKTDKAASPSPPPAAAPPSAAPAAPASSAPAASEADVRESVTKMRVKEIKAELTSLGVRHADAVEKLDLVERLVQARMNPQASAPAPAPPPPPAAAPPPPPSPTEVFTAEEMERQFAQNPEAAAAAFDNMANNLGVDASEAMAQAEKMMNDPEAAKVMMEMQNNPRVMQAAMDIAMNGEAAAQKYASDPEVIALLQKLEKFQ